MANNKYISVDGLEIFKQEYLDANFLTQHQDISGKQDQITSTNKLSADLIEDGTTNKTVTSTEKSAWNGKQDSISDLSTIRTNASNGASAYSTISTYGDIVTHDADEFAEASHGHTISEITNLQTTLNGKQATIDDLSTIRTGAEAGATAVQPGDLATVATSGDYTDLSNTPTIPTVNNTEIEIQKNGTKVDSFTVNQSGNKKTINITVPTTASDIGALPDSTVIPTTTSNVTANSTAALTSGGAYTNLITAVAAGTNANEIKVTKAGSITTITVNNVANATNAVNATNATNDADGNEINHGIIAIMD